MDRRSWRSTIAAAIVLTLAACSPPLGKAPGAEAGSVTTTTPPRERARWVAVTWNELPGWDGDAVREVWPALLRSCEKPAPSWAVLCAQARSAAPSDDGAARAWLMQRLVPHRVEAVDGVSEGLATGYFEPLVEASRIARGDYRVALHAPPADLTTRKPYWTRQQLETLPQAKASLVGREIAYVTHPLDALMLQV